MKKIYALLLAAVMVFGLSAAVLAMDFSAYVGGDFKYTFANSSWWGWIMNDGLDDIYYPTCGSDFWFELDATAKLSDNVTAGAILGYWYEADGDDPSDAWEDWCPPTEMYLKITDVFGLFDVRLTNKSGKIVVGPQMNNLYWVLKGHPAAQITMVPAEGFSLQAVVATPDADEFGYILNGSYTNDLFTIKAGYAYSPEHNYQAASGYWDITVNPIAWVVVPASSEAEQTVYGASITINAIDGLKLGGQYANQDGMAAYLAEGTFTGVEGLSITGKYGHKDNGFGTYVDLWGGVSPTYFNDMAGWFEYTSGRIDMLYVKASYKLMDSFTLSGSYAQDSWNDIVEYLVRGDFAVTDAVTLYGLYRSYDDCPVYKVGANVAVGGGVNLDAFYLNDGYWGAIIYGATISVSLW